ncbi:histidine phosphatase family protein [bacterium]|nr:histidine phosphatase family protein [bacterium]
MKNALLVITLLASPWFTSHIVDYSTTHEVATASSDKVVFLVRHGETCSEQGSNPNLSPFGSARANELSRVLVDVDLEVIFSTPFNRTLGTATPVAASHDLEVVQTPVSSGFLAALANDIKTSDASAILVAGHSNTTPALVNLLIGSELEDLSENDFDRLFVVTLHEDGTGSVVSIRYGLPSGRPEAC